MTVTFINSLTQQLIKDLPGKKSHEIMKVSFEDLTIKNNQSLKKSSCAAVLICLFPDRSGWNFFLTRRSDHVTTHKGQISLPGGMIKKEESPKDASLRETYEEIGIHSKSIKIIGELTPIYVPISNFKVYPFIGWINKKPNIILQKGEVSKIFSISIKDLVNDENLKKEIRYFNEKKAVVPYFHLKNQKIWGATSLIISEFKFILKEVL